MKNMEKCNLCKLPYWSIEVPPDIKNNSIFLFIGKQPGKQEATTFVPFTGDATYGLRVMLKEFGIENRCSFTNLVRCYPQNILKKNGVMNCLSNLVSDIEKSNPEVIIILGTDAAKIILDLDNIPDHAVDVYALKGKPAIVFPNPAAWIQQGSNSSTEDVINLETVIELILKARKVDMSIIRKPYNLEAFLRRNFSTLKIKKLFKASGVNHKISFPKINKNQLPKNEAIDVLFKVKWQHLPVYRLHPWLFEFSQMDISIDEWNFSTKKILDSYMDKVISLDFETNHLNTRSDDFRVWAVGLGSKKGIISIHTNSNETARDVMVHVLREHSEIEQIAIHNLNFELSVIKRALGIEDININKFFDTQATWHLMVEKATYGYSLKNIIRSLGIPNYDIPAEDKQKFSKVSALYNIADVFFTLKLYELINQFIKYADLTNLVKFVTNKLPFVIEQMQFYGMKVDQTNLHETKYSLETNKSQILNRLNKLPEVKKVREIKKEKLQNRYKKKKIIELPEFNPNSRDDLSILLFDVIKEKPTKRSKKTGLPSIDVESLQSISGPVPRLIERYRKINKLLSTYINPFLELKEVHANFFIHGTTSGRLSSSGPNMQNIPSDMRKIFIAREGYSFIELDVSKAEAMMFAILSKDPATLKAIKEKDFHKWVASKIFRKSESEITKKERSVSKTATFAILYGCTPQGLQSGLVAKGGLKISEKQAEKIIKSYMKHLPIINNYRRKIIDETLEKLYITTPFKRVRRFYALKYLKRSLRSFFDIHSQSVNYTVQSSLSDLFQAFVIRFFESISFEEHKYRIVNSVHDSILIEVKDKYIDEVLDKLQKTAYTLPSILESMGLDLSIPMQFELKIGKSWGSMEEFKVISTEKQKPELTAEMK